jgi:hypothetical protein
MEIKKPENLPPFRLFDRFTDWSGWETLYEHRRKVFGVAFLVVALLLGFVWLIAQYQTSSLNTLFKAETLVSTITNPEDTLPNIEKDSEQLFTLSENNEVLARFCGTLAQEDILRETPPLTQKYFEALEEKMLAENNPDLFALAKAAIAEKDICLKDIEGVLSSLKVQKKETSCITLYTYLLIQKAKILSEQGTSPSETILELSNIFSNNQNIADFFENWLHCNTNDFLTSLEKK